MGKAKGTVKGTAKSKVKKATRTGNKGIRKLKGANKALLGGIHKPSVSTSASSASSGKVKEVKYTVIQDKDGKENRFESVLKVGSFLGYCPKCEKTISTLDLESKFVFICFGCSSRDRTKNLKTSIPREEKPVTKYYKNYKKQIEKVLEELKDPEEVEGVEGVEDIVDIVEVVEIEGAEGIEDGEEVEVEGSDLL